MYKLLLYISLGVMYWSAVFRWYPIPTVLPIYHIQQIVSNYFTALSETGCGGKIMNHYVDVVLIINAHNIEFLIGTIVPNCKGLNEKMKKRKEKIRRHHPRWQNVQHQLNTWYRNKTLLSGVEWIRSESYWYCTRDILSTPSFVCPSNVCVYVRVFPSSRPRVSLFLSHKYFARAPRDRTERLLRETHFHQSNQRIVRVRSLSWIFAHYYIVFENSRFNLPSRNPILYYCIGHDIYPFNVPSVRISVIMEF